MEIKTKHSITKKKIKELPLMTLCLCLDDETKENIIIIRNVDDTGTIISTASNCREPIVLKASENEEVLFIGKIVDLDIVNIELENE
jgi:hypothetical protein